MKRNHTPILLVLVIVAPALVACGGPLAEAAQEGRAVKVEAIAGSDLSTVTLTAQASERVGIETAPVGRDGGATVVPYSAVLYDEHGAAWVYTNPEELMFVRAPISIDDIVGDVARLKEGPPPGTRIVTVGVAELYGAELGVGDPE